MRIAVLAVLAAFAVAAPIRAADIDDSRKCSLNEPPRDGVPGIYCPSGNGQ